MKDALKKLLDLLTPQDRKQGYILLIMILIMALFDMIGVASIFPFISVLINPEVIYTNYYISKVYYAIGFSDSNTFIFFLGFIFFIILVIATIYKAITTYFLLRFTHMRNYSLSRRVVKGYLFQPYDWFLGRHSSDLANTILFEVGQVINGVLIPIMMLVAHSAVAIALLILLIIVEPKIAIIMTIILGGSYSIIYFISRNYLSGIGTDRVKANQERYKIVQEAFGGIKSVKITGLENLQLQRYEEPAIRLAQSMAASQVVSQLPKFALELIVFGGMLLILLHMMSDTNGMQKALPIISLYALAGYRLMPALQQIYNQLSNLRFSLPALDALHKQMIEVESRDKEHLNYLKPIKIKHCICIKNVTYKYPGSDVPVLENLTLKVPLHTTVGIVGATGSGKTTIVDIILGLLRPDCGQLLIDDIEITTDNLRAWQRSIGYVPQEIYLSDSSIAANIAFGIPEAEIDKSAVEYSSQIANLHKFVTNELTNGYETIVGERGVRLSGGQRQRIGIARALYHNPDVLIFDEATSALDNITERAIIDAVHNLGHCKTIILIAHRLTTVKECDQIFLLDQGAVVDQGRYDELIKNNAQFCAMVSRNKIITT